MSPVDYEDVQTRKRLAKLLMRLFDLWHLDASMEMDLLDSAATSRRKLTKFRTGASPLPRSRDVRDRVGYLFAIHRDLRLLYPENPELRCDWVNRRNEALNNLRPIEVMREQGLIGIARIAHFTNHLRER